MRTPVRRSALWTSLLLCVSIATPQTLTTKPSIPEEVSPVEEISLRAQDGHEVIGAVRKPAGSGRFPAVVMLHGGLHAPFPKDRLKAYMVNNATVARFLAAGYVAVFLTYRSRAEDPQAPEALWDVLAIVNHVKRMPQVDPDSVAAYGCSGGGDLALELAAETKLAAIALEEPGVVIFTGMFNRNTPKSKERFVVADAIPLFRDPRRFYSPELQSRTRKRIHKIDCPILIVQGDQPLLQDVGVHRIIDELLIPELEAAGKEFQATRYPGTGHCTLALTPVGEGAGEFFAEMNSYFRRHLPTRPKP